MGKTKSDNVNLDLLYFDSLLQDAIAEQDTSKTALAIRGLLYQEGWSEFKIHSLGPTYSLTPTYKKAPE